MIRLIDADALIADLEHDVAIDQDTLDYEELTEINRANIQFDKDCKQNAIDLLRNAPTIEPERTGKWIDQDEGAFYPIECSECHKVPLLDVYGDCVCSDFCPHCGARMKTNDLCADR